jgi:hypothetical protein
MTGTGLMSGEKSEFQKVIERLCANREWLDNHIDDLTAQYNVGDWIAVLDGKVLAKGSNSEEVKAALGEDLAQETIIVCVPDKEIPEPI